MDLQHDATALPAPAPAAVPRWVIVAVAPLPLVVLLGIDLAQRPHYLFALLALPAAVLLARRRLRTAGPFEPGAPGVTRFLLVTAWLVLAAAVYLWSRRGGTVALMLATVALLWHVGGGRTLRAALPALLMAMVCLPLPLDLDRKLMTRYLGITASWAGQILDFSGVVHVRSGSWFEVPGGRVNTADLFNGWHSPFALAALALFVAGWLGRGAVRTPALVVTAVVFAVPLGAAAAALEVKHCAGAGGWPAWLYAALAFWWSLILALSIDQLLGIRYALRLTPFVPSTDQPAPEPVRLPVWAPSWALTVGFGALLAAQIGLLVRGTGQALAANPAPLTDLRAPEVSGWEKIAAPPADSPAVVFSARYRHGRQLADLVVFTPAAGHELPVAEFERRGWVVKQHESLDGDGDDSRSVRIRLERPLEASGTLWLINCTAMDQPAAGDTRALAARLDRRLGRQQGDGPNDRWLWVFVESYLPLDVSGLRAPEKLFVEARKALGPRLAGEEGAP